MRRGGALANSYIELLNSIEQKSLYSIEYKYIQEICNISRGKVYSKQYIQNNKGIYSVYSSQTENNGELGKINSFDLDGEYVTWTTDGAYAGTTFYREGKFSITNVCGLLEIKDKNKINTKYLNYILSNKTKLYVNKSMNNPKLMSNVMENIQIPIPSLEIQTKIVNILDKLQDYSKDIKTGLPLEIEQRQKQYEYYRNLLLDFKANAQGGALANSYIELLNSIYKELFYSFEYKSLDKICDVKIGEFIHKHFQNNGEKSIYPVFNGGIENTGYYEKYNHHDKVIISARGANAGFVNYVKTKFWAGNSCYVLFINNVELNSKYLYYQLKNKQENLNHIKTSASIPAISKKQVENFIIPIPSLEVQNKIVEILDKLYDYSNNLKDGLPLEIEQRQKQYKYYLNLLLKF